MAHFAEINNSNVVTRVIVVSNADTADASGNEKEYIGAAFCEKLFGGTWKQTSYNANFRKHYAGIGYEFWANLNTSASVAGAFVAPLPNAAWTSWSMNATSCAFECPVTQPTLTEDQIAANKSYVWLEHVYAADTDDPKTKGWVLV
ncbi:hypothetical protein [Marinobacter sp.]|uniref:hypothetical protein n=1 Tax=Marinobacter sp. TaxID=50741 RepID=UPI00257FC562|nr:hypothetical protein [Marinobacter sp.]|tara:strand:+ start:291 stop:728 length:438 start_codon:yes stop_codon:yes gene_type:complete